MSNEEKSYESKGLRGQETDKCWLDVEEARRERQRRIDKEPYT